MAFEELHRPLVSFGGLASLERAEVSAFSGPGVFLSGVEPILPAF